MDFFHVLNRGVDKRVVFQDTADYFRFTQNLYIYNSTEDAPHNEWSTHARLQMKQGDKLVTIHAYCLMPNHYHLLLSPEVENGIALYMKKVNMGYSKYFNEKNERKGALWQGKYKSIVITEDSHLNYIPYYIHLNALDLTLPKWRSGKITNTQNAVTVLQQYKWSSHRLFMESDKIRGSVIDNSFFVKEINHNQYLKQIKHIISDSELAGKSEQYEL